MTEPEWTGRITVPSGTGIVGPYRISGDPQSEPVCRIDSDDKGVDDVAIGPVDTFRLERMSKGSYWCAVYAPDGSRHVFWLESKSRITVRHHKEPSL